MTEMCFVHCSDNFFTRELSTQESNCLDRCVLKFSNVNQRVMSAYVHDQALINERRMKEMEEQVKANEAALAASAVPSAPEPAAEATLAPAPAMEYGSALSIDPNSSSVEPISTSSAPILQLGDVQNQSQSQTLAT